MKDYAKQEWIKPEPRWNKWTWIAATLVMSLWFWYALAGSL